jgi:hypothetical protein
MHNWSKTANGDCLKVGRVSFLSKIYGGEDVVVENKRIMMLYVVDGSARSGQFIIEIRRNG